MAARWLAERWLRRRWTAALPLALVVAVGTAGTVVAVSASERTRHAYREYLERAEVSDVVINPSVADQGIDSVIRSLPGVEEATTSVLLRVTNDDGAPRPRWQLDAPDQTVRRVDPDDPSGPFLERQVDELLAPFVQGSSDGRWRTMDRPALRSGRLPTGPSEAVLSVEMARATGLEVGDVLPVAFWPSEVPPLDDLEAFYAEEVEPLGREQVEVVGTAVLADEVLPDELYPRQRMLLSPDLVARYECLPPAPSPGLTYDQLREAIAPAGCAVNYRYWSLALTDGAAGVKPLLDAYLRATGPLNEVLTDFVGVEDVEPYQIPQYFLIPTETEVEAQRVERAVRPTVAALLVLGLSAMAVTVVLGALLVVRELRRTAPEQQQWLQLGVTGPERTTVLALPLVAAVAVGVAVGLGASSVMARGPVGLVDVVGGPSGPVGAGVAAGALTGGLALLIVVAASWRAGRQRPVAAPRRARTAWSGTPLSSTWPALADGARASVDGRRGLPVIGLGSVLVAALVAALVFGASLAHLVSTPRSYGWTWDVAAVTGFGYGDLDLDGAKARYGSDPEVEGWSALGLLNEVSVDGEPQMAVLALDSHSPVDLALMRGTLPLAADEVALGATTAAHHGVDVGDTVELGGAFDPPVDATVTGIVVFPTLGPFEAERVGAGNGLLLSDRSLSLAAAQYKSVQPEEVATFIGLDLAGDDHPPAVLAARRAELDGLDLRADQVLGHTEPVRPPEIVDARASRGVPAAVATVVAALGAAGLVTASWAAARNRRRDLAVLRALGFDRRQVRRSLRAQALTTTAASLALGIPLGVLAGRVLWRSFAEALGVLPAPPNPLGPVLLTVASALAAAAVATVVPGRLATRSTPARDLRRE